MEVTLLLSIATLLAGPILFWLSAGSRLALSGLDGLVRIAVGGLLILHILPHAWFEAGWIVFPALLSGLFLPELLDRRLLGHQGRVHRTETILALAGLALHAFIDGAALASNTILASAVILHRLPVGLAVWWLVKPAFGTYAAVGAIVGMCIFTVLGSSAGEALLPLLPATSIQIFEALMAGALLHVVIGHPKQLEKGLISKREKHVSALGGLLGVAILVAQGEHPLHAESLHGVGKTFINLFSESAPALLIASFTIAFVKAWMPTSWIQFFKGGGSTKQALKGTLAGLPVPICSCGVIPMYKGMVEAGTPIAAAMAFLVAAPELGWASMILSFGLLGSKMTFVRILGAGLLAIAIGIIIGSRIKNKNTTTFQQEASQSLQNRLKKGFSYGFGQLADSTGPWILLGLGIAAFMAPVIETDWLASLPTGTDVIGATLIGLPLYVCASGSTPLVAMLLLKGLSPGAALAFLLTGPATNVTTFGILKHLHNLKVAISFSILMPAFAIALGFTVNQLTDFHFQNLETSLTEHSHTEKSTFSIAASVLMAIIYVSSVFRLGVPGILAKITNPHTEANHGDKQEDVQEKKRCCSKNSS